MMKAIAAFKFVQLANKNDKNSSPASKKNCISLLLIQQQHVCCLIFHFDRRSELSQQQNVAELIFFVCIASNATEGSTPFVMKFY
jgi:hypothetical protein